MLDAIWNACGFQSSLNYDPDGILGKGINAIEI
jgi:hypothetical protein